MSDSDRTDRNPYEHTRALVDALRKEIEGKLDRFRVYVDEEREKMRAWAERMEERLIKKIESHNRHRSAAIQMVEDSVGRHETDLMRGEDRPGWVQQEISQIKDAQKELEAVVVAALGEEEGWVRRELRSGARLMKWLISLLVTVLLGLCANLFMQLTKGGV